MARIFSVLGLFWRLFCFQDGVSFAAFFFTSTEMQSNKIGKFVIVFWDKVVVQLKLGYTSQTSLESFQFFFTTLTSKMKCPCQFSDFSKNIRVFLHLFVSK